VDKVDGVVIGAGVVGLAVARALVTASPFGARDWMVLEATDAIGTGTSSRNSEVIHAGIYYPYGSLKAQLCVQGRHQLYEYLEKNGIGHKRCGKLIVATHESKYPLWKQLRPKPTPMA
jgi:L-2-hydroxyglutarate oxidase LhgO